MFDSCKTSTNSNHYISTNHLTIGKNIETKTKHTHCIRRLRFKQQFEQQQQTFINIHRHQTNHFCMLNKQVKEEIVDDKLQIATQNTNRRNILTSKSVIKDPISRPMDTTTSSGETETAKTTTITTNMMSIGRRKQELSLFIPQALNMGQIRVRIRDNNSNEKRKRTTAKMTTKRLMTTKSIISVLVLTFMLHLFMQTSIGAQAIKLPSFLSWIQPASQSQAASKSQSQQQQQSLNSATIPTQQHSLIHKHHHLFGTQNVASSSAANSAALQSQQQQQQQQDNEPMLVSASSLPEAKTQQAASGLRRPFQSMLLLAPSKHNHLFSALPKTLFGRLLSSSSTSLSTPSSTSSSSSSTTPPSSLAMPTIAWTASQKSANQQHMAGPYPNPTLAKFAQEQQQQQQAIAFNLNQYRQQLQLQQQYQMHQKQPQQHLRQLSINLPKKHALGLGEGDEFMIVDASGAQHLGLEQISNQDQLVQKETFEHHQHPHQHNYNHRQQQSPRKDYQEMPAIVITDQELEQQPRPVFSSSASNTSQATESGTILQAQDSSNSAQISLEASKLNNSSELQIDSSSSINATQATVLNGIPESGVKENATKSNSESLASIVAEAETLDVTPSQQSAVSSSSNQTVVDNDKLRLAGENSNYNTSGTNVLTTLISDELSKLKQEPEVLNKTLSSMSQPLVTLFLQHTGSPVTRSNSNENSSSRNIDFQKTTASNNNLQPFHQPQPQSATLENSSENGDLESSAAAIIVSSPVGSDSENSIENSRALGDQLSGLSDEQIESFIIGPYKGLTSDSSSSSSSSNLHTQAQQILPTEQHHQFRDLPSSGANSPAAQFLANIQAQQMRPQQQQQQHNHQAHFSVRPQQSHVGLGMSSMASNLIQQAKSLIHLPFAHLATSQMTTNHIPAVFRGQQQQISMSTSPQLIGSERFLLNRPDMMIDQSSSPSSSFHMQQAISSNKQLYNGSPLKQPLPVQMMHQEQGNHRYRHQQQHRQQQHQHRRPFYRQQQIVGPQNFAAKNAPTYPSLSNNNQHPMFGQNSATNLKPIHETQFGIQHNNGLQQSRYFIRPVAGTKQQQPQSELSNVQSVEEKQASSKPRMPYFGEIPSQQMQQHSMNRELVQLGAPNKFDSFDNSSNATNNDDDNNLQPQQQHLTVEGRQKVGKSHPLNDLATSKQGVQQSDFHFVVNHGGQVGFQPTPSVQFEQQQPINDAKQQQQQQQQVNLQTKFKSGLYQIDPPKLADGANTDDQQQQQQQQEHVAIPDGESDSPAEEDEQQRQYLSAEQQTDQQRHLLAGSEPQSSQEVEDDDSEGAQQQPDTRENESSSVAQDFARQVGAIIGVGANNKTKKGQVFNEPIAPVGELLEAKRVPGGNQRSRGKNLTQMKKLKHTQDITLYDFEMPQRQQQQQQASSNQLPKQIAQPVSYLDTQVYTIPYTINIQQAQAGNNRQQVYGNTPSVSASYQTTSFQQPTPRLHRPHQQPTTFNPYSQIGRFPLFYLPPPSPSQPHPQALHDMVAPSSQAQQQYQTSNYQHAIQHTNANLSPKIVHEQVNSIAAQTAPRPLHSNFEGQLYNQWPTSQHLFNSVPALAVQSINSHQDKQGIISQNSSSNDEQQLMQLTNSFEPAGTQVLGINNKQHYFHYQPVASLNQANQEQQHVVTSTLQENGARQLTNTEQAPVYEFPVAATQGPIEQQQQQQQQQQAQPSQATESSQLNDFTSPNVNRDSSTDNQENSNRATASVTANDEFPVRENGEVPSSSSQSQNERHEQNVASEIEPEREQQQFQLISQSSNQISSPSAFCADRAPGLYADISQRCKSYYQCAPTGHQMFHCNNQTQFNQKTQNCDWWYNVNCGGRLGSQADFEQAPVSSTTAATTTTTTSQATTAESNNAQSGELLSRQPDRDAVASSIVVNQDSSSVDNGVGQQVAPLSVLILTDDQSVRESEEQQKQQQFQQSNSQNGASDRYNSRWNQQQQQQQRQQQQREETDMFHHSDSMANITVAPEVNDNQPRQQQLAAPSSTPSYSELQASAIKEIEAFAQRSSTTQDPLLGAQEQQFNTDSSSQQQQQSVDSQPQVGAILTGSDGPLASSSSTAISNSPAVKSANQNESPSSSLSSSPNQSSSSVTSDPTISADATTSIQTNSASSEPEATTTTSSSVATQTVPTTLTTTTTTMTTSQQQSEEQPETTNQENNQSANNKGRRLVQSEFGLGAKQGPIATKLARSTSRFQFTRNSAISNDNLFSGKVLSDSGDTRPNEQYQQHANHRYKLDPNDRAAAQIYSTSANQGSVNYMPADEHNNYLAAAAKVASQEQAEQQVEGVTGTEKRAEKRFGERLINVEKTTAGNNEKQIGSANRTQKR